MKKVLLITLGLFTVFSVSTCKPEEEEKPCGIDSPRRYPVIEYLDNAVVQNMKPAATSDRNFLWQMDITNVCPSTSVKGNYYLHVRKDMDSGLIVRISRTTFLPNGGFNYGFPTVKKTQYAVNSGTYYLYNAEFQEDLCGSCATGTPFAYSLRIEVEVKPGFGDAANYVANSIKKLVVDSEYTPFKN